MCKIFIAPFAAALLMVATVSCRNDLAATGNETPVAPSSLVQQPYGTPYQLTDGQKYVYDVDAVPSITLNITAAEWNKLLSYYDQNPKNEEYVKGNFNFVKGGNPETLNDIGLRLRGNTSRRRPEGSIGQLHNTTNPDWHHASFTLNFKKYSKDQLFHSAEKLILKWFKDDPVYAREVYAYDLFERFGVWTAAQSSYCRLTIKIEGDAKPAYFGVYQLIEPVDDTYLSNRKSFFSTEGNLWKANYGADLKDPSKDNMGIEKITLTSNYTPVYDYKSKKSNLENAKTQLADFINHVNNKQGLELKNYIDSKMDVDLFLKTYAVNVMVGMWDDYWNNKSNYYFYFDGAGKFYFIPYDYDNILGTSYLMTDSGTQNPLNWGDNEAKPLVAKVLSIVEYKQKYINYLKDLADKKYDLFYVNYGQQRISAWQSKISAYVTNDTGEDMSIYDAPASWGNKPDYKLMSGTSNNFFVVKAASIPK